MVSNYSLSIISYIALGLDLNLSRYNFLHLEKYENSVNIQHSNIKEVMQSYSDNPIRKHTGGS